MERAMTGDKNDMEEFRVSQELELHRDQQQKVIPPELGRGSECRVCQLGSKGGEQLFQDIGGDRTGESLGWNICKNNMCLPCSWL